MKLLITQDRVVAGVAAALLILLGFLLASIMGLEAVSVVLGLLVGIGATTAFFVLRVLEPLERGIDRLAEGYTQSGIGHDLVTQLALRFKTNHLEGGFLA